MINYRYKRFITLNNFNIKKIDLKKDIHGIFLLDKPQGISSNKILQKLKHLFNAKKAGHTGSLDPLATGLLPICFGDATKFSSFLLNSDKRYVVTAQLGVRTTTADSEGDVLYSKKVDSSICDVTTSLNNFVGRIMQKPPIYSALKYQGKPLYKYALEGKKVDIKSREVVVYEANLLSFIDNKVSLDISCSKGTYIRSIVDDLGELLGCGAHVISLRRISAGPYNISSSYSFDYISSIYEDKMIDDDDFFSKYILPIDNGLAGLPSIYLNRIMSKKIQNGVNLSRDDFNNMKPCESVKVFNEDDNRFIGVASLDHKGILKPKRLLSSSM